MVYYSLAHGRGVRSIAGCKIEVGCRKIPGIQFYFKKILVPALPMLMPIIEIAHQRGIFALDSI